MPSDRAQRSERRVAFLSSRGLPRSSRALSTYASARYQGPPLVSMREFGQRILQNPEDPQLQQLISVYARTEEERGEQRELILNRFKNLPALSANRRPYGAKPPRGDPEIRYIALDDEDYKFRFWPAHHRITARIFFDIVGKSSEEPINTPRVQVLLWQYAAALLGMVLWLEEP